MDKKINKICPSQGLRIKLRNFHKSCIHLIRTHPKTCLRSLRQICNLVRIRVRKIYLNDHLFTQQEREDLLELSKESRSNYCVSQA